MNDKMEEHWIKLDIKNEIHQKIFNIRMEEIKKAFEDGRLSMAGMSELEETDDDIILVSKTFCFIVDRR